MRLVGIEYGKNEVMQFDAELRKMEPSATMRMKPVEASTRSPKSYEPRMECCRMQGANQSASPYEYDDIDPVTVDAHWLWNAEQKMELHPVETEAQYERALEEISKLMEANPEPGTERRQTLSALVKLVDQYEREHHAIDAASPVELIRHHMEQRDLTQAELADRTGISEPRISEVLNEKRELSKSQIAALSDFFDVSPGLLFPDAPGESPAAQ